MWTAFYFAPCTVPSCPACEPNLTHSAYFQLFRHIQYIRTALSKRFPDDTCLHHYWLPSIRAANAISRKDPDEAIRLLDDSSQYELGQALPEAEVGALLYPIYLRGRLFVGPADLYHVSVTTHRLLFGDLYLLSQK